jgi:hypothetical protein
MNPERTSVLIRCSREEAEKIRAAAKRERRTLSGYVVNAVMDRIASEENLPVPAPPRDLFTSAKVPHVIGRR